MLLLHLYVNQKIREILDDSGNAPFGEEAVGLRKRTVANTTTDMAMARYSTAYRVPPVL